jgi:drug/metabolite transporter (DMT)-like permease
MPPTSHRAAPRTALWQLLVGEVLIGSVGVFVHESGQDPVTAVFYRCLFGALFLIAWGLARGHLRGLWQDRALLRGATVSGVLLVLNWVALFAGMARSSIGVATMVYHFFPFVMLILAALVLGAFASPAALHPGPHWIWLAGLGVIHSGIVYVLFYSSYRHLPVATIAVVAFVYPLVTLVLDYALYGHRLDAVQLGGLALIVVGTLGVNLKWPLARRGPAALDVIP